MATDESSPPVELGLRERKKLETRQRISDIATAMFVERGFEEVRVADIAAEAGVSEKTVFNYFPTKESLVFDQFDEQLRRTVIALTRRPAGMSPTQAYVGEINRQLADLEDERAWADIREVFPRFGEMFETTPALRAAWGDHRHALVGVVTDVLATELGVDPQGPEPRTFARALVSLTELSYDSIQRHVPHASSVADLLTRVDSDLQRGARLLEAGFGSSGAPLSPASA